MNFLDALSQIVPSSLELSPVKIEKMEFLPINVDSSRSRYSMVNFEDFTVQLIVNQRNVSEASSDGQSESDKRSSMTTNLGNEDIHAPPEQAGHSNLDVTNSLYQNTIVGSYFRFHGLPVDGTPYRLLIDGFPIFFMSNNDKINLEIGQRRRLAPAVVVENSRPVFDLNGLDKVESVSRTSKLGKSTHAQIASVFPKIESTYSIFLRLGFVYSLSNHKLESLIATGNSYCDFSSDGFKNICVFSCGRVEESGKAPQSLMYGVVASLK
ncbi:hypothetical protein [Ruegeria sp. Ofav3-42]|uniref:hypothetical protein n=1 Tax=Ruegeria sp. Ofav3-42 TaxID=2917759 RepID=UPI001EF6DB4B|nr:hypothetical protein [Ruegeria sp. Ofav3-42]MCG7522802.1 hypothetical protein [Ruegeria sp. Ofav3-42]